MNGINIIAAQGKFNIHAQANALDIFAKLGITISSTENRVEINSSKEVQITGKSSRITLNGAGILCETDRMFEVKSGQQMFQSGIKKVPNAHDQIVVLAKDFSDENFIALIAPIFGFDIPDSLYLKFKADLESGVIQPPEHIVTAKSINGHAAGFNHQDKKIYVAADTILSALEK
ncbi:hypothetical protein FQR65_LT18188 [Abscondita terminalis]|nr:hypothetical protein FQR65_LT18188 [Abscondita terminalis]